MKRIIIILFSSLVFISCSEETLLNPVPLPFEMASSGVKSKIYMPSAESTQVLSVDDFEYKNGVLQKKIYYSGNREAINHYEVFSYNSSGLLLYKHNYYSNKNYASGFFLMDSTAYHYQNNLLFEEKTIYPAASSYEKYIYEYNGARTVKKSKYSKEELNSYFVYEYENDNLQREINYYKDNSIIETREYKYNSGVLTGIFYYGTGNILLRIKSFTYNDHGKLILEKIDMVSPISSTMPYVIKYEY